MNIVLSVSPLMTAGEVRKQFQEMRKNPLLLLDKEFELKEKLFGLEKKK
ncbi:hypothetical protein [Pseudobacillus badius]|nr:hypothetical protein [Bacillus badius]GLY09570.1 hypothetical protein Bbad01_07860 [Bacillus badius]